MKLRSSTMDDVLRIVTTLIFLWLVILGFVLYTKDEWMMWK